MYAIHKYRDASIEKQVIMFLFLEPQGNALLSDLKTKYCVVFISLLWGSGRKLTYCSPERFSCESKTSLKLTKVEVDTRRKNKMSLVSGN